MKLSAAFPRSRCRRALSPTGGFTLPELLTAVTIFTIVVAGIVFAHLYGLSMFRYTETKLYTTDHVRATIARMADEIRACTKTSICTVTTNDFVSLLDGERQEGAALLIYPTTSTSNYIAYFVNPADATFRRTTSLPDSAVILARSVTNALVFNAQDYLGNVLTNLSQNYRVIHVGLEFYQPARFRQTADYYKLETSVTRRALDQL